MDSGQAKATDGHRLVLEYFCASHNYVLSCIDTSSGEFSFL